MDPQAFLTKYARYAVMSQIKYGVPASITLAQAMLESNYGESGLTKTGNNFFGIKAQLGYAGPSVKMDTLEYTNNIPATVQAAFRSYTSPQESFDDHAKFLKNNGRYAPLFKLDITDYISWARGLQVAGYATDPAYPDKLINLVTKYSLTAYDKEGVLKKK